ncbi:MAG: hypothetical protein AAF799_27875 [Myxococcota bacterium]
MKPTLRTTSVMTVALSLAACQAADEASEFRSTYTTNSTLSGGDSGGPSCEPDQVFDVDSRRSLFETHQDALTPFTMESVLHAVSVNAGLVSQPATTHDQFVDTYNPGPGLDLGGHCDDEVAFDGTDGLNGYPHECGRAEGNQIGNMGEWFPIAAVNRFDLAPSDGSNCGEARLVMANNAANRMFVIFEAQIPNPDPECGISACAPVQEFWASLTDIDDPAARADELRMAYMDGHPDLDAAGFGPFLSKGNLTFGTGQIRTNNFDQFPWSLREFKAIAVTEEVAIGGGGIKPTPVPGPGPVLEQEVQMGLAADGSAPAAAPAPFPQPVPLPQPLPVSINVLRLVQVPVAANPFGELWNDNLSLPESDACQDAIVDTVQHLMTDNPNLMGVSVPHECLAAESPDEFVQQYHLQLANGSSGPGSLTQRIQDEIFALDPGSTLTPANIARRAAFAGGCIGCHQQTNGANLGNGVIAPSSAFFVHTHEGQLEDCGNGDISCFRISDGLKDSFLPHRKDVMDTYLNGGPCCEEDDGISIGPIGPIEPIDPIGPVRPGIGLPVEPIAMEDVDIEAFIEAEQEVEATRSPTTIGGGLSNRSH